MSKIVIEKNLFCLPWTQTLLGTHVNGKANFMALDWLTRVNYQPAMLGICVNKGHASNAAIRQTGEFSVNIPTVEVFYRSPTQPGKKHAMKLADEAAIAYPPKATLGKDTGFQGYAPLGVLAWQPKKSPKVRT